MLTPLTSPASAEKPNAKSAKPPIKQTCFIMGGILRKYRVDFKKQSANRAYNHDWIINFRGGVPCSALTAGDKEPPIGQHLRGIILASIVHGSLG